MADAAAKSDFDAESVRPNECWLLEFESIDGTLLKQFMAERLVLNYSNVELQHVLF